MGDGLTVAEQSPESAKFAATWQATDKVVFSSTLAQEHTQRTRLERQLDAQVVAELKAASRGDLTIGGLTLATEALWLDLVDVVNCCGCVAAYRCCRRACAGTGGCGASGGSATA